MMKGLLATGLVPGQSETTVMKKTQRVLAETETPPTKDKGPIKPAPGAPWRQTAHLGFLRTREGASVGG